MADQPRDVCCMVQRKVLCGPRISFFLIVTKRDGEGRLLVCEKSKRGKFLPKYLSLLDYQDILLSPFKRPTRYSTHFHTFHFLKINNFGVEEVRFHGVSVKRC